MVLVSTLAEAARRFGPTIAYVAVADEDGSGPSLTYADLDRRSDEVAAGLARRGVTAGDVVALVLPPGLDYPVCYLAAAKLGAITAGVNTRLAAPQRQQLLDQVEPAVVLGEGGEEPAALRSDPGSAPRTPLPGPPPAPRSPPQADTGRPVAIVFTSGTTGTPRGAVFLDRQLAAITAIDVGGRWGGGGRGPAATSFAHLGFMTKLPGALHRGGTTYVLERWDATLALALASRLHLTTVAAVPTQIALLLRRPERPDLDLSSVRQVLMGGGPATPALVRRAREAFGAPVCVRYSCTEAGIGTGTGPEDPPEDAELTVGRPQPGVEVSIRSEDGTALAPGEVGEVHLRSEAVMDSYWRDPEATAEVRRPDGSVRTGDLGFVDERGRLHLAGRSSERYVRGGYNVHPAVVEGVLAGHPGVADVAVVAVPDEVMGEVGVAAVVVAPGSTAPTLDELRAFAAEGLAHHELPERMVVVDALPLTAGDKVDRRVLRERVTVEVTGS